MKQTSRFCGHFRREVAERPVANRRQKKIKLADAITLAPAEVSKRQLSTPNVRTFLREFVGVRVPVQDLSDVRFARQPLHHLQIGLMTTGL